MGEGKMRQLPCADVVRRRKHAKLRYDDDRRAGVLEGLRIAAEIARAFDCMPCRAPAAWGEDGIEHYNDGQIDACGSIASAIEARAKEMGLSQVQPDTAMQQASASAAMRRFM